MVFGWGKKKSANEIVESTARLERQVSLSEISGIIKENEDKRIKIPVDKAKTIRARVDAERKNIIQIISQLEQDKLESDDIDKHLRILIERGKNAVIPGLRKETTINFSKIERYSDIVNLNSEIGQMLKRIGDILGVNSRVMHAFARKYADKLKDHLAKIATDKANLQRIVDEHTKFESNISNVLDLADKIKNSKNEIEKKNQGLLEIKKEIENHLKTIQKLEDDTNNLKSKTEYKEYLKIKNEIESLAPESNKIKHEIDAQFSKISRPLGKYSYISSLEKPLRKIMEIMIEEPSQAITSENKGSIIEVLQAVVKGVVSGNVSVKDSQKAVEQIEETISRLDEFLKMKQSYLQKLSTLESKMDIFDIKTLQEVERTLQKTRDAKTQAEHKIDILEEELGEIKKLVPQIATNIERDLREIINAKVTLKIQD